MRKPSGFQALRRRAAVLREKGRPIRMARLGMRMRLDPGLAAVVTLAFAGFALFGWLLARVEDTRGFFDPPLLTRVEDRRFLADSMAVGEPVVDMVVHGREAVLARRDGAIHAYDMERELFRDERIPEFAGLTGRIAMLASSCEDASACAPSDALFAVTENGGLVARRGRSWRLLVGDDAWIGRDGSPVEQEDVRLWATSDDGRWLLAWAGERGMALFDQQTNHWRELQPPGFAREPEHMIFTRGEFWLGGERGLAVMDPTRPNDFAAVEGVRGTILDLESAADGDALVLAAAGCSGGASCLSIYEADGTGAARRLVGEDEISPSLANATVNHAALQDGRIVLLGDAGVHVYDPSARSFRAIEPGAVDALHAGKEGRELLFAVGDRAALVEGGRVVWKRDAPERIRQMLAGPGGSAIALLRSGAVANLAPEGLRMLVHADPGIGEPAGIVAGAFFQGTLILLRGGEAILHDPVSRRYATQPDAVPADAAGGDLRLLAGSDALWLVEMRQGRVYEGLLEGRWPARTVDFLERAKFGRLIDASAERDRLLLIDGDGAPWLAKAGDGSGPTRLVGNPQPEGFSPVAAAADGRAIAFTDGRDVALYDLEGRDWTGKFPGPESGVRDLAIGDRTLLALSQEGDVFASGPSSWNPVAGGRAGAPFASDEVNDALASDGALYLAGRGAVAVYRPEARRIERIFGGGDGSVQLLAVLGGAPVWRSGEGVLHGNELVSHPEERVLSAGWTDDGLVYMAEEGGQPFAVSTNLAGSRRCAFRGGPAPPGELVDARLLPDGRVFVLTAQGQGIYEPEYRRWVQLFGGGAGKSSHLEILRGHLFVIEGGNYRGVPLEALPRPDSCDDGRQRVEWPIAGSARQIAVDAAGERLIVLQKSGEILQWADGLSSLLPPPSETVPETAELRRVYADDLASGLSFATSDSAWLYSTTSRLWDRRPFVGGPGRTVDVDLVKTGSATVGATVWGPDDLSYGGDLADGIIPLNPLERPALARPKQPPEEILDMASHGGSLAILGIRTIEIFDRGASERAAEIRLPIAEQGWSIAGVPGTGHLVLADGPLSAPARLFVIDLEQARRAESAGLTDAAFGYRPGDDHDWMLSGEILWRIDGALALHSCVVAVGSFAPQDCDPVAPPPARLDPDSLVAAAKSPEGETFLQTRDALLTFDPANRPLNSIAGLETMEESSLFEWAERVRFWEGPGGALHSLGARASEAVEEVVDLRSVSDRMAAIVAGGLLLLEEGGVRPPELDGRTLAAASMDREGRVYGLDGEGRVADLEGNRHLPELVFPADAVAVAPGRLAAPPDGPNWRAVWSRRADGRYLPEFAFPADTVLAVQDRSASATNAPRRKVIWTQRADGHLRAEWSDGCGDLAAIVDRHLGGAGEGGSESREPPSCRRVVETGLSMSPSERLLSVRDMGEYSLIRTTEADYRFGHSVDDSAERLGRREAPELSDPNALSKARELFRAIDGESWFAPPELRPLSSSRFEVRRGSGEPKRLDGGKLEPLPAFDLGWIGWERDEGAVRFGDSTELAPEDAIREGRFLPDAPGRAAWLGGDRFAHLNAHGLWHGRAGSGLEPVRVEPMEPAIGLAHGRFLFEEGGIDAETGTISADSDAHVATVGPLRMTETLRGGGLEGRFRISTGDVQAFEQKGFVFDIRIGVTALAGASLALTPVGLAPVETFAAGVAVPAGTDAVEAFDGGAFARTSGGWRRYDGAAWTASDPPRSNRELAVESGRRWRRVAGRAEIAPIAAGEDWRAARDGLVFDADMLRALSADRDGPVLVTGVGTHDPERLADMAPLPLPSAPDPGTRSLDSRAVTPGRSVIWAETGIGRRVWDRTLRAWRSPRPDERPWEARLAASLPQLEVRFDSGEAVPRLRVEDVDGASRFAVFSWQAGEEMPFDRVRGFVADGRILLLATDFGLRRLRLVSGAAANESTYSGVNAPETPLAFAQVDRPDTAPDILLAEAGGKCFEFAAPNVAPVPCAEDAAGLDRRRVARTGFWHWWKGDTEVRGSYLDAAGTALAPTELSPARRMPHDRLRGIVECGGDRIELWAGDGVLARVSPGGTLDQLGRLAGAEELACLDRPAQIGNGASLASGIYAIGAGEAWQKNGTLWKPETRAEAVARRARGDVVWETARLRATLSGGALSYEYRWNDDVWRPLNWADGKLEMDAVTGIVAMGGGLQLISPAGVYSWSSSQGGIAPDGFVLRTPDDRHGLANCDLLVVEARDGSIQAVPAEPGNPVALFCRDGRSFLGNARSATDVGTFRETGESPFVERVLVDTPAWRWTRSDASAGGPALGIRFKGEEIVLSGGRLSIDDYAGLAAPFPGAVEIVTQADGWWRFPREDLAVDSAARPPKEAMPEEATAFGTELTDGELSLCVEGALDVLMHASGKITRAGGSCRDFRGADRIWDWHSGASGPTAEGETLNGIPMQRNLREGRFDDLHVVGAPLIEKVAEAGWSAVAPTRIGALLIGEQGSEGVYGPSAGFLVRDDASEAILVTRDGPMPLAGEGAAQPACRAVADLPRRLPKTSRILRVRSAEPDATHAVFEIAGRRIQMLVPCDSLDDALVWSTPADVRARGRYRALDRSSVEARLLVGLDRDDATTVMEVGGLGVKVAESLDGNPVALLTVPDGRATLVATDRALYRIDTDRALSEIASRGSAVATPKGLFETDMETDSPRSPPRDKSIPAVRVGERLEPRSATQRGNRPRPVRRFTSLGKKRRCCRKGRTPAPNAIAEEGFGIELSRLAQQNLRSVDSIFRHCSERSVVPKISELIQSVSCEETGAAHGTSRYRDPCLDRVIGLFDDPKRGSLHSRGASRNAPTPDGSVRSRPGIKLVVSR